jgi:hypothetical protein
MKRSQVGALVVAVAAVAIGIAVYLRKPVPTNSASGGGGSATGSDRASAGGSGGGAGNRADNPEDDAAEDTRYRVIDADARMALIQRISAAREARKAGKAAPGPTAAGPDNPPALPGELTPDQIMEGILPVMPLLKECYEQGLERRTIKNGKVTFSIHLTGEPEIGTLVDRAELDGDPAFLADAELSQCLHQTMMSLELPPMSEGSELKVTTTMVFSDDPDDGEPRDAR